MDTTETMTRGIDCLLEELGTIGTERFISEMFPMFRDAFDYTEWRKRQFDGMSLEQINAEAVRYEKEQPFVPRRAQVAAK